MKSFSKLSVKAGISLGAGDSKAPSEKEDKEDADDEKDEKKDEITAGANFQSGLDVNVEENQKWTSVTENTFNINQVVTVPAFRTITIDGTVDIADNVELGFTCQILVSMTTIRLTKYSRVVVKRPLPIYKIKENLLKHVDGRIVAETEEGILWETNGTLRGTFGVEAVLRVSESPVISG